MKRILSLVLAAVIAASLASCAALPEKTVSSRISVTSSDAESVAEWLAARLGEKLADRVVLGTQSEAYGVDVSALEDDGYVIRRVGDEMALFARTAQGLDRAARKYAKAVERGERVADETFREGARIEKLMIAGNDISEYSIAVEGESAFAAGWITEHLADTMKYLLTLAASVEVPVGADAPHLIVFREVKGKYAESEYSYRVENGDLILEYSNRVGARNAMEMFLERELGWENVVTGDAYLPEADSVDVPEGTSFTGKTMFPIGLRPFGTGERQAYDNPTIAHSKPLTQLHCDSAHASHGLEKALLADIAAYVHWYQICYTDEALRNSYVDTILGYVDDQINAGVAVGDGLYRMDISQGDNLNYCHCTNCVKVYNEEGGAMSGAVVRWANAIAADMEEEGYGGLNYAIFAYHGTNQPCRTAPRDDVWVTFCLDGNCYRHPLSGEYCQWGSFDFGGVFGDDYWVNNADYAEWLAEWCRLSPNIQVWYYAMRANYHQYNMLYPLYEDVRFMHDIGVGYVYYSNNLSTLSTPVIESEILWWLQLHPEATKADYEAKLGECLERRFGDGWRQIYEAQDIWDEAELRAKNCENGWTFSSDTDFDLIDNGYYFENWDHVCELLDEAILLANTEKQENAVKEFAFLYVYYGCYAGYFPAYEAQDDATLEKIAERYAYALRIYREAGKDPLKVQHSEIFESLDETAWKVWAGDRALFFEDGSELRPIPQEYIAE